MLVSERARELTVSRRPFVHATVVRAQEPTSARAGDDAVILADGSIEGFVGGVCAESSVRAAALDTLKDGNTVLLRVLPDDGAAFPETPGALVVVNPCHSGGAIEIFLRPVLPRPLLSVAGNTPIARAVAELAAFLDFDVVPGSEGASAVVVAGLGRDEERAIRAALDAGVPYVALVAGRRRAAAVLDGMGLTDDERTRVRAHAGLAIGARGPKEIALAILAEVVREIRVNGLAASNTRAEDAAAGAASAGPASASAAAGSPGFTTASPAAGSPRPTDASAVADLAGPDGLSTVAPCPQANHTILPLATTMTGGGSPREGGVSSGGVASGASSGASSGVSWGVSSGGDHAAAPRRAVDPVCGMTVLVDHDTPHAIVDGQDHWFCRVGCRDTFVAA